MPIYEYHVKKGFEGCNHCKKVFEVMQKINDNPLEECPKCESPLEKLISKSNFILKGGYTSKTGYSNVSSDKDKVPSDEEESA